ncbi:MAG: hypothetical protein EB150_02150 [Nitrososphaeria archaeon]|nr:hypothetical protein [Nitrososphaeria archaeon]NDB51114.1 hypothetical protein [Nitrosopumilaceae archaeon]NDB87824.1 hypothetical protein [Nitrososphaerota archaeon]NDB47301.1 hypothetical protein [Nitrososphaeria archaeon]NDB89743.1 hypothetical protein [Nitrososphaerota archaeon]
MTESGAKGSVRWKSRGSYGRILHRIIKKLSDEFDKEQDMEKCIRYARTIAYTISVGRELINDEQAEEIERRLAFIEKELERTKEADSRDEAF